MRQPLIIALTGSLLTLQACKGCNDQEIAPTPTVLPPTANHDFGSWLSMKVSPEGRPAIAYYDRSADALGYALGTIKDGKAVWVTEAVDSYPDENGLNPGDAGKYASLAFAPDGVPWIVYQDTTNGSLKYSRKADGGWSSGSADGGSGPSGDAGYWASLAIDKTGNPVATHYDKYAASLRLARWNGSSFDSIVVDEGSDYVPADTATDPISANVGEYSKIYVDTDGTEYIAYYDRANGALKLAVGSGSTFAIETVDDDGDVGQWPDLLVSDGTVHIAYQDITNQHLKHAYGHPGNFSTELVDTGSYTGADTAIYMDGSDLGIIYFDGTNNDQKAAQKSGDAWNISTVTGAEGALGYHNETVFVGDQRYTACYDYTARTIWFGALP